MRDHTWYTLSKESFSATKLKCFPLTLDLALSPDLSPIENMWPMVAEQLTQITPPCCHTRSNLQRVEAAWSAVPQDHIQSLFESMPRRLAAVISNSEGYTGY
ncbi:transposable element Tcb1 transposase [Trichonephila clavipes]|nr:transposable element Tcb1 transposase [Trichonephila clavipes]